MAKQSRQKIKLLYLMQLLQNKTDETHTLTMQQIITELKLMGVTAERKSVYDDMEALRMFGVDVCSARNKTVSYYVAARQFELPELKLLVDSVQASQFITERKSLSLIRKLEGLCSVYDAKLMRRQVYVANRIKNMNESIYYNVDKLHNSIACGRKITFRYFEYTLEKKRTYRRDGRQYCVSPFALTWDNENYYLIAYDSDAALIKHYRVDKMESIALCEDKREGEQAYSALDMAVYTRRVFSMFGGENRSVELEFVNRLAGVVFDRFGRDVAIVRTNAERFKIVVPVIVSPQFYAWMFALGDEARILGPEDVVRGMRAQLDIAAQNY